LNEKAKIRIEPLGIEQVVNIGTPLIDVLYEYGIEFPCGGKGKCGKCRIKILKGELRTTTIHQEHANTLNLSKNERLSCMCFVSQDVTLKIEQFDTIILADYTQFKFTPRKGLGIAIDLGSTTIVGQLIDLGDGKILDSRNILNPQTRFGADIMSRIDYAVNRHGKDRLKNIIRNSIRELIRDLSGERGSEIKRIIIVGNAAMHHLFCDIDVTPLTMYPFDSEKNRFVSFKPDDLGLHFLPGAEITFYPVIGSFIGSDILAGIMATELHRRADPVALIDLGTNGEIVLGNKEKIICASTAAGPAFEGINISSGMRASTGAISSVHVENSKFNCKVIGNERPKGVCGSGLIDSMALFLREGMMDDTGQITENRKKLQIADGIFLTQKDIREFQLAKGAIAAGMEILTQELQIKKHQLEQVYIAGAFGNFINLENASFLGILEFPVEKITKLGNSALIGAKMALFQDHKEWEEILEITSHISLESFPEFQDVFTSKLFF